MPSPAMDEWAKFLTTENFCLTFGPESPPCDRILSEDKDIWVRVRKASSGKSLTVIQLEFETDSSEEEDLAETINRFEEL